MQKYSRNNYPLISVIIPSYNYGRFLKETIKSVTSQTYHNIKILVVDDGSTDNTSDIIRSVKDKRLRYIYQKNAGANAARNLGIARSRGEYIAFLDADDLWLPNKLEKQMELFRNNENLGLVYSLYSQFESETNVVIGGIRTQECYRGKVIEKLYRHNFIGSPTPLIKKEVFKKVGVFEDDSSAIDDWFMWTKIANVYEVDFVPEILASYRIHAGASSYRTIEQYHLLKNKYLIHVAEMYPVLKNQLQKELQKTNIEIAQRFYHMGYKGKSIKILLAVWRGKPWKLNLILRIVIMGILPKNSIEKHNKGRVSYVNGKIFLFAKHKRIKALQCFVSACLSSPLEDKYSYWGIVLCFCPKFILKAINKKYFSDFYSDKNEIIQTGQFLQY